jgi:molecular chaperone DnaK
VEDAGIGMEAIDELILVGGMTRMPLVRAKVAEIFGREPDTGVNPDEGVAAGAAIQAGVLSGRVEDILLLDVTPLSLGVETQGGVFTKIIEKNTTIPSSKSQVFSTTEDNQDRVRVHVLQGERDMADDNMTLGRFELVGLPPAPRGVPQVEVTFALDPDGVAHVSAKDLGTGKSQGIVLTASSGLTEDEVERLVREAESHAEEDSAQRGCTDLCNKLEGLVYSTERTLEEFGDEVTPSDREPVEAALVLARASLERREVAGLEERIRELSGLTYSLTEKIYATLGDEGP